MTHANNCLNVLEHLIKGLYFVIWRGGGAIHFFLVTCSIEKGGVARTSS